MESGADPLLDAERLLGLRRLPEALTAFYAAEQAGCDPERISAGRWLAAMLAGDFEAAWQENDGVRARHAPDPHRMWNGESVAGRKVIVRCLHGFGDAVMMLRFAPRLAEVAHGVTYQMAPRLLPLAGCFAGVKDAVSWSEAAGEAAGEAAPEPPWDLQVEIMELPYLFRLHAADLPAPVGYCKLPHPALQQAADRMGKPMLPRVGIVWAAGRWNPARSLPFRYVRRILEIEGCEFWNLQGDSQAAEGRATGMRDAGAVCGDGTAALAAAIAHMDLVITVDTFAAHLAGAMGIPVWLLLGFAADWRWMHGRDRSPWYPSMRIFRQSSTGDWKSVTDAVTAKLREWMVTRA